MTPLISLIGYGEVGRSFATAAGWKTAAHVFDIKPVDALYQEDGVTGCDSCKSAITGSPAIISVVTADQALNAAQNVAREIAPGALFFDMNSVAPDTKYFAAQAIDSAGGIYVDVAIMAPVNPARLAVPLLVSGPQAQHAAARLTDLGFSNVRVVAGGVGQASAIKMIRSIMIKGQEALTAEMMQAAERAGVGDDVLASLGADWRAKADYNLERMRTHGVRRAAEMEEVAKTLIALGVDPVMTRSTILRQREMANDHDH